MAWRTFEIGDRVDLLPFEDNPEEVGTIIGVEDQEKYPGMYIVQIDDEFLVTAESIFVRDDGLREVHADQMQLLHHTKIQDVEEA